MAPRAAAASRSAGIQVAVCGDLLSTGFDSFARSAQLKLDLISFNSALSGLGKAACWLQAGFGSARQPFMLGGCLYVLGARAVRGPNGHGFAAERGFASGRLFEGTSLKVGTAMNSP